MPERRENESSLINKGFVGAIPESQYGVVMRNGKDRLLRDAVPYLQVSGERSFLGVAGKPDAGDDAVAVRD